MTKSKKSIIANFGLLATPAPETKSQEPPLSAPLPRVGAGVIGAAQRSIGELRDERDRLKALVESGAGGASTLDPALTIAMIERDYGLPPVNLSRVENAQKPFGRWNPAVQRALFALFGVADESALRAEVEKRRATGVLDAFLATIANPETRIARTRERVAELLAALREEAPAPAAVPAATPLPLPGAPVTAIRLLPVFGAPLPHGLIGHQPTGKTVEAPHIAGPRAFGLKVCRATLGGGLLDWVAATHALLAGASDEERTKLLSGNAKRLWKL